MTVDGNVIIYANIWLTTKMVIRFLRAVDVIMGADQTQIKLGRQKTINMRVAEEKTPRKKFNSR